MTPMEEVIAAGWKSRLSGPGAVTPPGPSYSANQSYFAGATRFIANGQVTPGDPNRDMIEPPFYSTNKPRIEVQQAQHQWNQTSVTLFECMKALASRMDAMMSEIGELRRAKTFVVPLTTLPDQPLRMTLNIPATVEGDGEEFTATFIEANVSASGETEADAIANLKESLVSTFEFLESLPEGDLGPLPARQWEVLRNVLTR